VQTCRNSTIAYLSVTPCILDKDGKSRHTSPFDVLMYNEKKRDDVRNCRWLKASFSLPVGENLCSYANIVAHIWDVMVCKVINENTTCLTRSL